MPCPGEAAVGKLEDDASSLPGGGGEFRCLASYPSAARSLELGRQNLHLFRLKNTRFDFIGGGLYFLIVVRLVLASLLAGRPAHRLLSGHFPDSHHKQTPSVGLLQGVFRSSNHL